MVKYVMICIMAVNAFELCCEMTFQSEALILDFQVRKKTSQQRR